MVARLRDAFGNGSQAKYRIPSQLVEDIGMDGVIMFKQHDINDDGFLSLREFEPIAHQLLDIKSVKVSSGQGSRMVRPVTGSAHADGWFGLVDLAHADGWFGQLHCRY